jgi:hypothetical protein
VQDGGLEMGLHVRKTAIEAAIRGSAGTGVAGSGQQVSHDIKK